MKVLTGVTGVKVGDKRCDREEGEIGKWQVVREVKSFEASPSS